MLIIFSFLACVATLFGGIFALRFKDRLHLILGFSAGAVIGVAFFDLLPESLSLGAKYYDFFFITTVMALGFTFYTLLDRMIILHSHHDETEHRERRGILGAGSLSVHSFLDGLAIGLAFQVSQAVGSIVTIAVLTHDFSDGINTVSMVLKNQGGYNKAFRWLLVDAVAPIIGVASTLFFSLPENILALVLALFSGFFIYIGASDLLPESHHAHPTLWTTLSTILGMATLFAVIRLAAL
ncbi:ZIP family metal transporter [Patescibacteria group bacterium]|nr:ZIP family metal transporter [Patescibacteria group bacterium]